MGLIKELTDVRGVKSNYYRVSSVYRSDDGDITVKVLAYTSKDYRNKEKEFKDLEKQYNKYIEEGKQGKWKQIEENELFKKLIYNSDLSVWSRDYILQDLKTFSFSEVYSLLKEYEDFKGAEDSFESHEIDENKE